MSGDENIPETTSAAGIGNVVEEDDDDNVVGVNSESTVNQVLIIKH